ncbi:MAG: hypothetical protein OEZ07_03825 [Dehalococcoidia bacterium]|nr:hypothetical protein [Dehalococcoidia bacterium]
MKKLFLILLIGVLALSVVVGGCVPKAEVPKVPIEKIRWDAGTTKEGTTNYVATATIAELTFRYLKDYIEMSPVPYTSSTVGLKGYDVKEVDSMYASTQQVDQIMTGTGAFSPDLYKWTRPATQLFWTYDLPYFSFIRAKDKDKITCWNDFAGKKVFPQMKGTGTYEILLVVLGPEGLDIWDKMDVKDFAMEHSGDALKLGEVDVVCCYGLGKPVGWGEAAMATLDCAVVPPSPKELEIMLNAAPWLAPMAIDPVTYFAGRDVGLKAPMDTYGVAYVYLVDPDMDEEYTYQLTKCVFEHSDELVAAAPGTWADWAAVGPMDYNLKYWQRCCAKYPNLPLHPGVKRYLKELGYDLKKLGLE